MRWSRFWQRRRRDDDLRRELDAYLEEETAHRIADGMPPDAARAAALRKLGNVTRIRETVYEQNSLVTLETWWQDVAFGVRLLYRNPGFAFVAIVSVALGIGANASVFTLLDQVMLRSLPVERPRELVMLSSEGFQYGASWGQGNELSYPMYVDLRDGNEVFSGMFGRFAIPLDVGIGTSGERVNAELVTGSYFQVLGISPANGRVFDATDERAPGAHPYVVLSHRYWRTRFQSDPAVIGTTMRVSNHPMTIVGIAREGFDGTSIGTATEIFVPFAMAPQVTPVERAWTDRRLRWINVFGRLRPGMSLEQAAAGLQPLYKSRLNFEVETEGFARASAQDKSRFLAGTLGVARASYGQSYLRAELMQPLWTLMAIGAGVLLIACANVANLLLVRATARRREIAMRTALGASRRRVMRQMFVESLVLAFAGGAAGVIIATWGAQALLAFFAEPDTTLTISSSPDARILAINVLVCVTVGVLFGLAPALQATRHDVGPVLKAETGGVVGGGQAHLRRGLVVAQVALSLLLLIGAGLFVRSLNHLLAVKTGFDTTRLLAFEVSPGTNGYGPAESKLFANTLLEQVRAAPGVDDAAFVSERLLTGGSWNSQMTVEGRPYDPEKPVRTFNNRISPGYFATLGIRVVAGRDFDASDGQLASAAAAPARRVVIVNEEFVRQFLDGRDPLRVRLGPGGNPGTATTIEIVGVVSTAVYTGVRAEPQPQLYFPYLESPSIRGLTMYVRTATPPEAMVDTMRNIVRRLDPQLPVLDIKTVEQDLQQSVAHERLVAGLSSVLGVLATVLAMVGLYGVMSYTVAKRTREIAIRVAFGAAAQRVMALLVADMLVLVVGGMLLALPAFWWLKQFVSSQLYGVSPTDALSILSACGLLLAAAAVAVWVPSRRALHVDPMVALRDE